jgi:signal transduction histidine kinase
MSDVASRLAQHRSLQSAPAEERAWLIAHGSLRSLDVGDVVTAKGEPPKNLLIILDGLLVLRVDRGAGAHKVLEWRGGDVGGVMPYSRVVGPPGNVAAEEPTELIAVPKESFSEMIRECPVVTTTLVHAMIDRARQLTSSDLRDEKLISLGKLAAGLAHELNNPASAVIRSAKSLTESLSDAEEAARELARMKVSEAEFAAIESARRTCTSASGKTHMSAVQRADLEESLVDWLDSRKAESDSAPALTDSGVTVSALDKLAGGVRPEVLNAAIKWVAACCVVRSLSSEIETGATRVSDLVSAVKGFSYMDHAPTPEPVDVRRGIADTLTMLGSKTKAKSINVTVSLDDDLSPAYAIGAELNQVWMNLLDNAIDAVGNGGQIRVTASNAGDAIVVSIIDDGNGIPEEIQSRIFDPFFTTKGVGNGTGLGLDVVRRLLQRHQGEVSVESNPGRTEFQVRLRTRPQ